MRRDEMAKIEHAPCRVGDVVSFESARVAAQLFVHLGKDLLLARLVPRNANVAVRIGGRVEKDRSARVVLAHYEIKHGVTHGAVRIVQLRRQVEIARQPRCLGFLVAGNGVLPADYAEGSLAEFDIGAREREVFTTVMRCDSHSVLV